MKNKKSSLLCLNLVFILLFLGMCSQVNRADSLLASFQHISEAATIEKMEVDTSYIGKCTNKLITGLRDTFQSIRRGQGRSYFRNSGELFLLRESLQVLQCSYFIIFAVIFQIKSSEITILNYIHDQDGEK